MEKASDMTPTTAVMNRLRAFSIGLLLVSIGSSCTFALSNSQNKPIKVTQLATILVTRDITQEVTRIIEVPVTVTPVATPSSTFTPTDNASLSNSSPATLEVTVVKHADCLYGPALGYLYKYSVSADNPMEAIGRNSDASWLYIQDIGGWNPCWIQSTLVQPASGDFDTLPVVHSRLPFSNQYNSPDASAHRAGSEVTITWKANWMSLDDYRGYLIEAWLCQGGNQIFVPIFYVPPLDKNIGSLSIQVTDEPGCTLPSHVSMYSAQKQGYSMESNVPWPPAIPGH